MIEVERWRPMLGGAKAAAEDDRAELTLKGMDKAKRYLRELIEAAKPDTFPLESTVRQLRRYVEWWGRAVYVDAEMIGRVKELLAIIDPKLLKAKDAEQARLDELANRWDDEVHDAGLDGATFKEVLRAMDKLHYRTDSLDDQLATTTLIARPWPN